MSFEPINVASGATDVGIVVHVRLGAESLKFLSVSHLNLWFEAKIGTAQAGSASIFSTPISMRNEKQVERRRLRRLRAGLTKGRRRTLSERASRRAYGLVGAARRVAVYLPVGTELDPTGLMEWLKHQGRQVYVPLMNRRRGTPLRFVLWRRPFLRNRHGIWEPRNRSLRCATTLDVIVVPLVGFDRQGYRLGQGGGHYDRTLAVLRRRWRVRPWIMGLGFECQRVEQVPRDWHDVRMRIVVTERCVYDSRVSL